MDPILADLKPEAAYFADDNGKRTGFIFFDLKDTSQIPAIAEPWFLAFDAHIELHPAMNLDDLKKATPESTRQRRITAERRTRKRPNFPAICSFIEYWPLSPGSW
jgi:hypothetical protein